MPRSSSIGLFLLGALLGGAAGAGVSYYIYAFLPQQEEFAKIEVCGKGALIPRASAENRLSGTDLHRFLIANQAAISETANESFFIGGSYRNMASSESSYGSYMISGSSVCVFESGDSTAPSFRTISLEEDGYRYRSYTRNGRELRSFLLNREFIRGDTSDGN